MILACLPERPDGTTVRRLNFRSGRTGQLSGWHGDFIYENGALGMQLNYKGGWDERGQPREMHLTVVHSTGFATHPRFVGWKGRDYKDRHIEMKFLHLLVPGRQIHMMGERRWQRFVRREVLQVLEVDLDDEWGWCWENQLIEEPFVMVSPRS